jgi:hypothetical protein
VCFRQAIIDIGTQRMQGNFPLYLFLCASDFRPTQASADNNSYTLGICAHCLLHRLLHRTTERDTLLQLFRDTTPYQVGIQFWLTNLDNVQPHALLGLCLQQRAQLIDLLATLADHNTRLRRINSDRHLVSSGSLNLDTRDCRVCKLFLDRPAD